MSLNRISKRIFLAIGPGQSNENGSGQTPDYNHAFGCPLHAPVAPLGNVTRRSAWPRLAEIMGKRGVWTNVYNAAVGSTSIIHCWTGVLRTWVAGMQVQPGTYVLNGGNVYKCTYFPSAYLSNVYISVARRRI
jgi:hypothetical protein